MPVRGPVLPGHPWDNNSPLDRKEYLLRVLRRVPGMIGGMDFRAHA
ncbi:hypothetical protein [Phytohabitans kaempferiae]|uniref:Uncharacterized protein n=1 Tax=Phytohabitans kaempferiae TaxID=1620943 RepID=A0ABV6MFE6_9ACTN